MQSITLRSHIGPDGILHLNVPVGIHDAEIEVTVTIRSIPKLDSTETAGALADDDSFIRHPQGEYEVREPL